MAEDRYALTDPDEIGPDYGLGFLHELARQGAGADAIQRQVQASYEALLTEITTLRAIRDRAADQAKAYRPGTPCGTVARRIVGS